MSDWFFNYSSRPRSILSFNYSFTGMRNFGHIFLLCPKGLGEFTSSVFGFRSDSKDFAFDIFSSNNLFRWILFLIDVTVVVAIIYRLLDSPFNCRSTLPLSFFSCNHASSQLRKIVRAIVGQECFQNSVSCHYGFQVIDDTSA